MTRPGQSIIRPKSIFPCCKQGETHPYKQGADSGQAHSEIVFPFYLYGSSLLSDSNYSLSSENEQGYKYF